MFDLADIRQIINCKDIAFDDIISCRFRWFWKNFLKGRFTPEKTFRCCKKKIKKYCFFVWFFSHASDFQGNFFFFTIPNTSIMYNLRKEKIQWVTNLGTIFHTTCSIIKSQDDTLNPIRKFHRIKKSQTIVGGRYMFYYCTTVFVFSVEFH